MGYVHPASIAYCARTGHVAQFENQVFLCISVISMEWMIILMITMSSSFTQKKAPIASSIRGGNIFDISERPFANWDTPFPLWFRHYLNKNYCNLDALGSCCYNHDTSIPGSDTRIPFLRCTGPIGPIGPAFRNGRATATCWVMNAPWSDPTCEKIIGEIRWFIGKLDNGLT